MLFKLHRSNGALNSPAIFAAVEQGIRAAGHNVTESQADIEVIWSVLWQGRMKPNQLIYERCIKNKKPNKTKKKKESGCTKPLYGKKAKCLLRIVPQEDKDKPFHVDSQCIKKLV